MLLRNILVVEDEDNWLGIYRRNIEPLGYPVRFAQNLQEATNILKEMAFAVAIVDMRLDKDDDGNVDGLRVFEEIVSLGDLTSLIVVTGYGTMQIARDAFKKYNAFETIEKGKFDPDPEIIEALISRAMENFIDRGSRGRTQTDIFELFRGERMAWDWEDEMRIVLKPRGTIPMLKDFLNGLASRFVPMIPEHKKSAVSVSLDTEIASGCYWSRAVGLPIVIVYGHREGIEPIVDRFLFSIRSEHKKDLYNEIISDGLRREFESNEILLSPNATISAKETEEIEEKHCSWLIIDEDNERTYSIKAYPTTGDKEKLNIYTKNLQKANDVLGSKYTLGKQLHHSSKGVLRGVVWAVENKKRDDFGKD